MRNFAPKVIEKYLESDDEEINQNYDRSSKKYSCYKYYDVNDERFFNGSKKVFVEFEF